MTMPDDQLHAFLSDLDDTVRTLALASGDLVLEVFHLGVYGGASLDDPGGLLAGTGKVHR